MEPNKKRQFWIIFGLVLAFMLVLAYLAYYQSLSAKLDVSVSPHESKITINGRPRKIGDYRVKPGKYVVVFSMSGFATTSQTVNVSKGKTGYANAVLVPNSSSTNGWYLNHPKDESAAEGISSNNNDRQAQASVNNNPLITLLPYIGPDFEYRVDYGNQLSNGLPIIYITGPTQQDQQLGLDWIKNAGFDPSKMNIQYITAQP